MALHWFVKIKGRISLSVKISLQSFIASQLDNYLTLDYALILLKLDKTVALKPRLKTSTAGEV